MSLQTQIPMILDHIERHQNQLQFNLTLYKMYEGQIDDEIRKSLAAEMQSRAAFERAIQRIPTVNLLNRVVTKTSKVYQDTPIRFTTNESDRDLMNTIIRNANLDQTLISANKMTNLHNMSALEIFIDDEVQKVRSLTGHQFLVYSDNPVNPLDPTVFIKIMGKVKKVTTPRTDANGNLIDKTSDDVRYVGVYALYSKDEVMVIDSDGHIRDDLSAKMGITSRQNPYGVIPFVYISKSEFELIPLPNKTDYDISILIPKLLTDLNYAAQFLSHSVIWAKNVGGLNDAEINPDCILDLGDTNEEGNSPEIGTINPESDIDGVLKLIEFQYSTYLSAKGVKTTSTSMESQSAQAGISKMIDQSDISESRKEQMPLYRRAEKELFKKLAVMQDIWVNSGLVKEKRKFSKTFVDDFDVKYSDMKPVENEKQKYDKIKIGLEENLLTRAHALKELYPNISDEQLKQRLDEIEEEVKKKKDEMLEMGLTPGFSQLEKQRVGQNPSQETQKDIVDGNIPE